jgi:hypothetical protein
MFDLAKTLRPLARLLRGLCLGLLLCSFAAQAPAGPEQSAAASLPDWVIWQSGEQASADGNWSFKLEDRSLSLSSDGQPLAKTPVDWQVQAALFADANADGEENLILLCWKQGKFGSYHPFG